MSQPTAYILCRFAEQSSVYNTWMDGAPIQCKVVDEYLPDWPLPDNAAIVITHMHYRWEEIHWLRAAYENGRVPILILADGILEYRNTWEHPELAGGAIFQPIMGHKLACIGRGQARTVESWGNVGKGEIVGLPRIDHLERTPAAPPERGQPFRLLIATANTPAFNAEQRETVIESLQHIKDRMDANEMVNGRKAEVTWRLTDGLEREIGLPEQPPQEELPPLTEVLSSVDAVITTPSTLFLESIYLGKPTAILDFHNCPHYVAAAWFINAPKHFNWILRELESPPSPKMMFQQSLLEDQLECHSPATSRLYWLIEEMVNFGLEARRTGGELALPKRIIEDPNCGFSRVAADFDLAHLYPDEDVFKNQDRQRLHVELSQAIRRLRTLPAELQEKNRFLTEALECLDLARSRAASSHLQAVELHQRVRSLRKRLGIHRQNQEAKQAPPVDPGSHSSAGEEQQPS